MPGRNTSLTFPQYSDDRTMEITLTDLQFMFDKIATYEDLIFIDPHCGTALKHLICLTAAPPCGYNSTDGLLPVCAESCLAYTLLHLHGDCGALYDQLHHGFNISSIDLVDIITTFECSNPSSYYHFDNLTSILDSQSCTDFFSKEQRG